MDQLHFNIDEIFYQRTQAINNNIDFILIKIFPIWTFYFFENKN
jgi:hypothetical protein